MSATVAGFRPAMMDQMRRAPTSRLTGTGPARPRPRHLGGLVVLLAFLFVAASCGGDGDESATTLPDVTVHDVGADTTVELASFTPASTPLLVWFWAPH